MCYACKSEKTEVPLSSIIAGINCLEDQCFLVFQVMCILHLFGKKIEEHMYTCMAPQLGSIKTQNPTILIK